MLNRRHGSGLNNNEDMGVLEMKDQRKKKRAVKKEWARNKRNSCINVQTTFSTVVAVVVVFTVIVSYWGVCWQ